MEEPLIRGTGEPTTVFAHGFGATSQDSRPFGSGVPGTKIFYTALAHDGSPAEDFGYPALAHQLRGIADHHGANRAFGVSMGAGALCQLVSRSPDRFDRLVFFLPAVLDTPRGPAALGRLARLGHQMATGDQSAVSDVLVDELPAEVRHTPLARAYAARHAATLCLPSMRKVPQQLAEGVAVPSLDALAAVKAPALVIGCHGDTAHPADVAAQLAQVLPNARLHLYDHPGVVWTDRADLRRRISEFLSS